MGLCGLVGVGPAGRVNNGPSSVESDGGVNEVPLESDGVVFSESMFFALGDKAREEGVDGYLKDGTMGKESLEERVVTLRDLDGSVEKLVFRELVVRVTEFGHKRM
jgi:hypothetical protein